MFLKNYPFIKKLDINNGGGDWSVSDDGIKLLNLIELNAFDNYQITNVNHMSNLRVLIASYECNINDDGIKLLTNLVELDASYNSSITNINHLTKLETLTYVKHIKRQNIRCWY